MATLSYDMIRAKVISNNKAASNFSTELITCQIWKESSFDPNAKNGDHIGLMQISGNAVDYVNANTPSGVHFNYPDDLYDPDKNIQCGTYYLSIWMAKNGTSVKDTLNAYGTGSGYADNILQCEQCIQGGTDSQSCLNKIHAK
jgi:soluble lytic murein transglycosylase-like protein